MSFLKFTLCILSLNQTKTLSYDSIFKLFSFTNASLNIKHIVQRFLKIEKYLLVIPEEVTVKFSFLIILYFYTLKNNCLFNNVRLLANQSFNSIASKNSDISWKAKANTCNNFLFIEFLFFSKRQVIFVHQHVVFRLSSQIAGFNNPRRWKTDKHVKQH